MSHTLYYLAFGSNLHPARLSERLEPVTPLAVIKLDNWQLCFHKRGADSSAKCDLVPGQGSTAFGALYQLTPLQASMLDRWEGGYQRQEIRVSVENELLDCFFYRADEERVDVDLHPMDWYLEMVKLGSEYLSLPSTAYSSLQAQVARDDSDLVRAQQNWRLVEKLRNLNETAERPALRYGHALQ